MADTDRLASLLDEWIEHDADAAERWILQWLARIELHKRLAAKRATAAKEAGNG